VSKINGLRSCAARETTLLCQCTGCIVPLAVPVAQRLPLRAEARSGQEIHARTLLGVLRVGWTSLASHRERFSAAGDVGTRIPDVPRAAASSDVPGSCPSAGFGSWPGAPWWGSHRSFRRGARGSDVALPKLRVASSNLVSRSKNPLVRRRVTSTGASARAFGGRLGARAGAPRTSCRAHPVERGDDEQQQRARERDDRQVRRPEADARAAPVEECAREVSGLVTRHRGRDDGRLEAPRRRRTAPRPRVRSPEPSSRAVTRAGAQRPQSPPRSVRGERPGGTPRCRR
jgi:hypothetical protein